jgi:hypothetical protein
MRDVNASQALMKAQHVEIAEGLEAEKFRNLLRIALTLDSEGL